jgi:hypothetical protein
MALKGEVMKSKKRLLLVIFGACIVLVGWYIAVAGEPVRALNETLPTVIYVDKQRDVLKGLTGVFVVVEAMRPEVEKIGLTSQVIQTDVELELRRFGIRVLSNDERMAMLGSPYLYVNVNAGMSRGDKLWGSLNIRLNEQVILVRQSIVCRTFTWQSQMIFTGDTEQEVRNLVKERVDEFINDYLAANPKEQASIKDANDSSKH